MSLKEKVQQEMVVAMKAKDQAALRTLRAIKSAIMLAETAEGRGQAELTPDEEMALLIKQSKQRKDSIEQFNKAGREDLSIGEAEELVVIERFLPKALSPEELEAELKAIIASVGASSPADLGKVMGVASKQLAGRADGKEISAKVRQLLS
jgi:hypothetical protein